MNCWNTNFKRRYVPRSVNCNLNNCKLIRRIFRDFNGIRLHGLFFSPAVLYQLSYKDPGIYWEYYFYFIIFNSRNKSEFLFGFLDEWRIVFFPECALQKVAQKFLLCFRKTRSQFSPFLSVLSSMSNLVAYLDEL